MDQSRLPHGVGMATELPDHLANRRNRRDALPTHHEDEWAGFQHAIWLIGRTAFSDLELAALEFNQVRETTAGLANRLPFGWCIHA